MRIKYKLSVIVIAILALVVSGISFMLLRQASGITMDLSLQSMDYLAEHQVDYWKGREDTYVRVLRTLANVMAGYEDIPMVERRQRFNDILHSTFQAEQEMIVLNTIWKPNSIDNLDSQYIGRAGAGPTGQFASVFSRETGVIEHRSAVHDIVGVMNHLNGPNSHKERVEDPASRNVMGTDVYLLRLSVPIINPRTNEAVGSVTCLLDIASIQEELMRFVSSHDEIIAMAIYTNNGFVIGHSIGERIGSMMQDVEIIYGDRLEEVVQLIHSGGSIHLESFSHVFRTNLEISLKSFSIGNSDRTWTVMIAEREDQLMAGVTTMRSYTIILALMTILIAAIAIFVFLHYMTKPIVEITETLKDISQGHGDLTHNININSKDELGRMARYFNLTMEKIKMMVRHVMNETKVIGEVSSDLANDMTETAAAMNQINANIQSIKQRMINQSASVTETNATMEQITAISTS